MKGRAGQVILQQLQVMLIYRITDNFWDWVISLSEIQNLKIQDTGLSWFTRLRILCCTDCSVMWMVYVGTNWGSLTS